MTGGNKGGDYYGDTCGYDSHRFYSRHYFFPYRLIHFNWECLFAELKIPRTNDSVGSGYFLLIGMC